MWKRLLAHFRLSKRAVCELSAGERDYHDYRDAAPEFRSPMHFYTYECERCGKAFTI